MYWLNGLHCHWKVVCIHQRGPTSSGSQLSSNPIRAGRWQPATGLFNSPNDIRASWSALTHSTNLHLDQHARHRGQAEPRGCVYSQHSCASVCNVWTTFPWIQGLLECCTTSRTLLFLSWVWQHIKCCPKDAIHRWLLLYDKYCKKAWWEKLNQWSWMKWTEGEADVGCFSKIQRGGPVGSLSPPCLWIALTQRKRGGAKTKSANLIIIGYIQEGNREECKLLQCCFQNEHFKSHKSIWFTACKIGLFVPPVMHNLVYYVNESHSRVFVIWTQMPLRSQIFLYNIKSLWWIRPPNPDLNRVSGDSNPCC